MFPKRLFYFLNFNPRSHKGSDISVTLLSPNVNCISIHAPTKGATISLKSYHPYTLFQSTLPQRERRISFDISALRAYFNPRSHKGSDDSFTNNVINQINFNPRSHKGSDIAVNSAIAASCISIHAPTKGATHTHMPGTILQLFQSTLPQRERRTLHYKML